MSVQKGDVVILQIGSVQLGALVNNNHNMSADMLDKSNKDTPGIKQYNAGETGWMLSLEALFDPAATEGFSEALGYLKVGTLLTVKHGNPSGELWQGSAMISNIQLDGPKNEISSYSIDIQGTGAVTESPVILSISYTSTQFVFKWKAPSTKTLTFVWGDGTTSEVSGNDETIVTTTSNYSTPGTYTFSISGDVTELTYMDIRAQGFVAGDITNWGQLTNLTVIYADQCALYGSINNFNAISGLIHLYLYDNSGALISGNISNLSGLTSLTLALLRSSAISGDAGTLYGLTSLTQVTLNSTNVTFDTTDGWDMTGTISLHDCGWTSTMVDNALAAFADTPLSGCTINIAGTNAARTAGSDADYAIVNGGNTLTVNS